MTMKLNIQKAREIRARRAAGERIDSLARAYGVGTTTIHEIVAGTRFREDALPVVHTGKTPSVPAPIGAQPNYEDRILHFAQQGALLTEEEFNALPLEDRIAYSSARARLAARID